MMALSPSKFIKSIPQSSAVRVSTVFISFDYLFTFNVGPSLVSFLMNMISGDTNRYFSLFRCKIPSRSLHDSECASFTYSAA